ncbi:hypothetical protein ACFL5V_10360 [Fibrobacterota bacterium]
MKYGKAIANRVFTVIAFTVCISAVLAGAGDFAGLKGYWQCQAGDKVLTLDFVSPEELLFQGVSYPYQLGPGIIMVQTDEGVETSSFVLQNGTLFVVDAEGAGMQCSKKKKPAVTPSRKNPAKGKSSGNQSSHSQTWPPPYVKPQQYDEDSPSLQVLLYKFAGRWDHVTTNTLTNLFLKPDGTWEESYEAGYSGTFTDQGGHQTGNWGAAGAEQAAGRWRVEGNLRQGKLYLTDRNGNENVCHYKVHIKGGEVYWGEYFFNGKLYAAKYIYR